MKTIPSIKIPIITSDTVFNKNLNDELNNKKVIIFGIPGAFTPTCSNLHMPGYVNLYNLIIKKNIDDIYCLSVNDPYVMKAWLSNFKNCKIKGISDGNAELTTLLNLESDKKSSHMGLRCLRFSMIVSDNVIDKIFIEEEGLLEVSSAQKMLSII